jgi:hypothetical protein
MALAECTFRCIPVCTMFRSVISFSSAPPPATIINVASPRPAPTGQSRGQDSLSLSLSLSHTHTHTHTHTVPLLMSLSASLTVSRPLYSPCVSQRTIYFNVSVVANRGCGDRAVLRDLQTRGRRREGRVVQRGGMQMISRRTSRQG